MFIFSALLITACWDDTTDIDLNDDGPNLASFERATTLVAAVADGEEYEFEIRVKVVGPTKDNITSDITLTIGYDAEASTAIEGTHFRIDNPTLILSPGDNLLGHCSFTMLTQGIVTPLDVSPILALKVTDATGDNNIVASGKPILITMNYACPSFLEGTYDVTTEYTAYDGTVSTLNWTEYITEIGVGTYRTGRVGHWTAEDLGGTPGFTFTDVCDVLSIPNQLLVDYYGNEVEGTSLGTSNTETGVLYMEYSICYGGNCRYYKSTYVKQ